MRLFRSEEHVHVWAAAHKLSAGAIFPVTGLWKLAQLWFHDRLSPEWKRRTLEEAHAIFAECGLVGDFWRLDVR